MAPLGGAFFSSLLTALLSEVPHGFLVAVDDPELGLHPELADRFWTASEEARPDLSFVYATHSIAFAARPCVTRVLVVDRLTRSATEVNSVLSSLDPATQRSLLGALPGILRSKAALLVEGDDGSIDRLFYEWLMRPFDPAVVPASSCTAVLGSARRAMDLSRSGLGARAAAVVDRDSLGDRAVSELLSRGVHATPYRDVEGLLCEPDLVLRVSSAASGQVHSLDEVRALLRGAFESQVTRVALEHVERRLRLSVAPSIPRAELADLCGDEELGRALETAVESQLASARQVADSVGPVLVEELGRCRRALDTLVDGDAGEALRLFSGKLALTAVARAAVSGCQATYLARVRDLDATDFPVLARFRDEIRGTLAL